MLGFNNPVPIETNGEANIPTIAPANGGTGQEGWYKSEFGCNTWPSFESISTQLPQDQWSMSSFGASRRNWNVANLIGTFFGADAAKRMAEYGEVAFKRQLYQSMLSQVLYMKTEIEAWRSSNIWGSTFWMYNEIWCVRASSAIRSVVVPDYRLHLLLLSFAFHQAHRRMG